MFRKLFFLAIIALFSLNLVNSATIDVNVDITSEEVTFLYFIEFSEDEDYSSFSFEKPSDGRVTYSVNKKDLKGIKYSVAGDYFIFKPDNVEGQTFEIMIRSRNILEEITQKNTFSTYTSFNFPVDTLIYKISVDDTIAEIEDIFPRNYEISETGEIIWKLENLDEDTLFLLNFRDESQNIDLNPNFIYYLGISLLLLIILASIAFFASRKRDRSKQEIVKESEKSKNETEEKIEPEESKEEIQESFSDTVNKYLTENEREVAEIVREHDGISQYDILNYLPSLTKSNLSKIVSKLHSKKFLSRIKVGKINKIYLGDLLKNKK